MKILKVALDNGHGSDYIGKWSPVLPNDLQIKDSDCIDNTGRFREYLFNRKIIKMLYDKLISDGDIMPYLIVPELNDISLSERKRRVNKINPDICISMHANAIGYGNTWENAKGFSIWTSRGQTKSDSYAEIFYNKFTDFFEDDEYIKTKYGSNIKILRDYSDGDSDYEANFAMLMVNCPAILIETMFFTNIKDVQIMMDDYFQRNYVTSLYNGLCQIWNEL